MWYIDIFKDVDWVKENWDKTKPKLELPITFQISKVPPLTIQVFGDEFGLKHLRLLLDTDSENEVQDFQTNHLSKIIDSVELFASIIQGVPFRFFRIPFTQNYIISINPAIEGANTPLHFEQKIEYLEFKYENLQEALSHQFPGLENYLFYLTRAMDTAYDLDYRWLNFYKIVELKYVQQNNFLKKNKSYLDHLERHREKFAANLHNREQSLQGLVESLRAYAAHSIAHGSIGFGPDRIKNNRLKETLPIIEIIAYEVINELPENKGLKFYRKSEN